MPNSMRIIGLTGGVGCGKSTVARLMREHFSCRVFIADEAGRACMEPGTECYRKIARYFGRDILREDKSIDRNRLSRLVFQDKRALLVLNGFVHPCVKKRSEVEIAEAERAGCPFFVVESAILFEAGYDTVCDEVWYVFAPESERRRRLKESRGYSDEKIDGILKNQMKDEQFRQRAAKVLNNTGTIENIMEQLEVLLV